MKQKIAILGLGQFGMNLSLKLTQLGVEVVGVDNNEDRAEALRDRIAHVVIMDTTEKRALQSLELKDFDAVVVAIGENFEASIMTTAQLQELGIKRIINRVISPVHERILKLMNVTDLILPEGEAAAHLARRLTFRGVREHLEISGEYSIVEAKLPSSFLGKSLEDLNLRKKYNLNLITVMRVDENEVNPESLNCKTKVLGVPDSHMTFSAEDILVLFGRDQDLRRFLES